MNNEYVLITGASSGIGKALAEEFAKHRSNLILVARRAERLEEVRNNLIASYGVNVLTFSIDLMLPDSPSKALAFCKENGLNIWCLINNAGIGAEGEFSTLDEDKQQSIIDLNISALMRMSYLFLQDMVQNRNGTIVNISSTTAFTPLAGEAVYAASKAFVLSFSQALYEENKRHGVTVCTICPGVTDTEFFTSAGFELNGFQTASPTEFAQFAYRAIMKKKPLAIHRFSNRLIALWARLFPRGFVRRISAQMYLKEK